MRTKYLLRTVSRLEQRLNVLEYENRRLRAEVHQLKKVNAQLKETLKQYADAAAAKKSKFGLNDCSERNEPKDDSQKSSRKKCGQKPCKPTGRPSVDARQNHRANLSQKNETRAWQA